MKVMALESSVKQVAELDRSNFIAIPYEFIPESHRVPGKHRMVVAPGRLAYSLALERVAEEFDRKLENTETDTLGRDYIGYFSWFESLRANLLLGNNIPTLNDFGDFGRLLYQGMREEIDVYNALGKLVEPQLLDKYFLDIFGVGPPLRLEWLDAYLEKREDRLYILTGNKTNVEKLDENTLMEERTPGISLEDWLKNPTAQGLPRENVGEGALFYLSPIYGDRVARFSAGHKATVLDFREGRPFGRFISLGVRSVRHE